MPRSWLLPPALALTACPQANPVDPAAGKVPPPPILDGRVIADSGDLYPIKGGVAPLPPPPSPGTGLTDETNGMCRLFAPELPNPTCCERQLGFDVATVQAACGLKIYLGESFHATCGYHFVEDATVDGAVPKWFRLSTVLGATAKDAADAHDRRTSRMDAFTPSEPIPGIPGAWWSDQDELHWAFLPGWSVVRMLTWSDESCSQEGIRKVLEQLVAAPEIPGGTPRTAVIPTQNPPPPPPPPVDPNAPLLAPPEKRAPAKAAKSGRRAPATAPG